MCCIYCIRVWVIILVTPCIILLFSLWWHSVCIMLSQEVPIHTIFSAVISISPFKKNGKNTFHNFRHIKYIVLASMFLNTNQNSIGNVVNIAPADLTIPGQKGFPGQFFKSVSQCLCPLYSGDTKPYFFHSISRHYLPLAHLPSRTSFIGEQYLFVCPKYFNCLNLISFSKFFLQIQFVCVFFVFVFSQFFYHQIPPVHSKKCLNLQLCIHMFCSFRHIKNSYWMCSHFLLENFFFFYISSIATGPVEEMLGLPARLSQILQ